MRASRGSRIAIRAAVLAAALFGLRAAAAELDRELRFASGLVEMGFPDLAGRLLDRLAETHPESVEPARPVRVEILIARRRLQEAEALAATMPDGRPETDAARLAIANHLFRTGETDRARTLYEAFFQRHGDRVPSDPGLRRFYSDAAYRYGQMLERAGDLRGAAGAYERVLQTDPGEAIRRRLQHELAALYVRAASRPDAGDRRELLEKAERLCDAITWGDIDLWFGRAIVTLANIRRLRGDPDAAERTLREYMDVFRAIEESLEQDGRDLVSSLSPLSGARFLLGEIQRQRAEAIDPPDSPRAVELYREALQQYYNVFAIYADSEWGSDAGLRAEEIKEKLEGMGRTVRVDLRQHAGRVAAARVRLADELFVRRDYQGASRLYAEILAQFPDTGQSPQALSNLLMCHVHMGRRWEMKAVAEHIAERYAKVPDAANGLLAAGKHFFDEGDAEQYRYFYDLFLAGFPRHPRAPAIAFTLAGLLREAGDLAGQRHYLDLLIREYRGDPFYYRALNMQAWSRYAAEEFEEAAELFQAVVEQSPPGPERAQAQSTLADALVRLGRHADALQAFRTLQRWLGPDADNPYATTAEERLRRNEMLERSAFFVGFALTQMPADADELPRVREAAIRSLQEFLEAYPESAFAARAMSLIGQVQIETGDSDAATRTFDELARRYPDSDEGRNARFSLIRAAVEIDRLDVARETFRQMMSERHAYPVDQLVRVSQWLLDAGQHEEALAGFEAVIGQNPADRAVVERTLYGLGKAAFEVGRYDQSSQRLTELLEAFPRSGLFFDALMTMGRAHREAGRLEAAVDALRRVFAQSTDPALSNTANLELASIQRLLAARSARAGDRAGQREQLGAAVASYQRVAMFGDREDPRIRPMVETAMLESIQVFMEMERFADAVTACDEYLREFPEGSEVAAVRRIRSDANLRAGQRPGG